MWRGVCWRMANFGFDWREGFAQYLGDDYKFVSQLSTN